MPELQTPQWLYTEVSALLLPGVALDQPDPISFIADHLWRAAHIEGTRGPCPACLPEIQGGCSVCEGRNDVLVLVASEEAFGA